MLIQNARDLLLTIVEALKDARVDKAERDAIRDKALTLLRGLTNRHDHDKPAEPAVVTAVTEVRDEAERAGVPVPPLPITTLPETTPPAPTATTTAAASTPTTSPTVPAKGPRFWTGMKTAMASLGSWLKTTTGKALVGATALAAILLICTTILGINLINLPTSIINAFKHPWHGTFSSSLSASGSSLDFTRGMGKMAEKVFVDNAIAQRKMAVLEQENSHKMGWRDQDQQDTTEAHRHAERMEAAKTGMSSVLLYNSGRNGAMLLSVTINGTSYSVPPGQTQEIPMPIGDYRGDKNDQPGRFHVTKVSTYQAQDGTTFETGCLVSI